MVECAGLEIRCTVMPYRGFESHLLRHVVSVTENSQYVYGQRPAPCGLSGRSHFLSGPGNAAISGSGEVFLSWGGPWYG